MSAAVFIHKRRRVWGVVCWRHSTTWREWAVVTMRFLHPPTHAREVLRYMALRQWISLVRIARDPFEVTPGSTLARVSFIWKSVVNWFFLTSALSVVNWLECRLIFFHPSTESVVYYKGVVYCFLEYLPWVSFITRVSSNRESRVLCKIRQFRVGKIQKITGNGVFCMKYHFHRMCDFQFLV